MALVIVIAAVGLPTCAGLIGAAGRSAGQARAIPPSWPTALPMDAEGILLQPGTYRMEWKDLSDIGEMTERYGFHRANDPISPTFLGVHSTRFLWSRAGNYLAVLDEDRGTGSGYDVIYLIPHLHSAPVSRAVKASISDGLRVPLKPYRPTARPVYRRTLKVAYSERPWLVPAEARPVVVDVRLGGPESTVVRKSELEIAVYQWKDHPGWIKAAPKYGWRGMVKTNAGLRIVAPVNSVGNGIYGDTVLLQMPGGSAEDLSCGRFYTYGAGVYSFSVSSDGSVLEVRSDEGREQAKIGAVLAELGKALRVGDTSTAADLFLTNFKQNLKSTTVEAFLKHAPVGKPDWRTALASSTAKTGQVHIFGLNADVMVLTQGQSPETSPAVDVNMVNENGKWLISSEPGGPYQPMREFSTPQYGNVGLEVVALIPADGTITAGEPLVAKLELKNLTQKTLYVHGNSLLSTRLEVYDSKGELVGATPVEPLPPDMIVGQVKVAPHESLIRRMVLSSLYRFVAAGEYTVRIQLLNLDTSRSVGAATETRVRVLPFDSRHLSQRCEEIFAPLRSFGNSRTIPSGLGDFPLQLRLQALYSIRSDEVLPYLSLIAREWDRTSEQWPAMTMIRRIGTPKAKALFSSLAARQDHVGEVARMVAKEPVRDQVDEWYVGDDWHRP